MPLLILESLYYHAMSTALGEVSQENVHSILRGIGTEMSKHKAWKLGYQHGSLLSILRSIGLP